MSDQVTRRFSFTAVWTDTAAMLRANAGLLASIAGVFLFLPIALMLHFMTPFEMPDAPAAPEAVLAAYQAFLAANWGWIIGVQLSATIGMAAITVLLLAQPRITVGTALRRALMALPFLIVLDLVTRTAVGFGLNFFLLPGLFLLGRFCLANAILMVERPNAPFSAIIESWKRTGWSSLAAVALIIIIFIATLFIGMILLMTIGILILLALGQDGVGGLLLDLLRAGILSVAFVVSTALYAALYRALPPRTA